MLLTILALLFNWALATDYCKLCENGTHTMCQFPEGPAKACINYKKISLTFGEKRYILDIHNDIRNHVASGQESRGALGNQPAASDMFVLEWDDELAEIAQRWVDRCIKVNASIQHDKCKRTERFEVGQNIVTAITNDIELPELSVLILNWYKQIVNVIPSDIDSFIGIWRDKYQIGQYTQLVWANTRFVGCAAAVFKETPNDSANNVRLVCNYGPTGNVIGQSVYKRGEPCSKCPHKMCDKTRPNLCTGMNKGTIKKQNGILSKKNIDKATTLSNFIDIENPKVNKPKSSHPSASNLTKINKTIIKKPFDFLNFVNKIKEILINATSVSTKLLKSFNDTSHKSSTNKYTFNSTRITLTHLKNNASLISSTSSNFTANRVNDESTYSTVSTFHFTPNTTLSTSKNVETTKNLSFRITFISGIKYFIQKLFNESSTGKSTIDNRIIDLTKSKCERKVKLDNGIILAQDCEGNSIGNLTNLEKRKRKLSTVRDKIRKIVVKGNDVILPGNRHFRKAKGIWHNGQCRCPQFFRSGSSNLNVQYIFLVIPFLHFIKI